MNIIAKRLKHRLIIATATVSLAMASLAGCAPGTAQEGVPNDAGSMTASAAQPSAATSTPSDARNTP